MLALRAMGLLIPPASAGILRRIRGILLIIALILLLLALGLGVVELIALPFGGLGLAPGVLLGLFVAIAGVAIAATVGRRRRDRAAATAPSGKKSKLADSVALRITTGLVGAPSCGGSVGSFAIVSTPRRLPTTFPTSAYCGGSAAFAVVTMKNWLPDVPDGSVAVLAIATVPSV
jgi:hypothetical protein